MKTNRILLLITTFSVFFALTFAMQVNALITDKNTEQATNSADLLLAQVYQPGIDVKQYLVSEKFDGVRALWDGKNFHTRTGRLIAAPAWFTKGFPKTALDGELWLARGQFDALSGAVRKDQPIDAEWRGISYLVFELPNGAGTFAQRAKRIGEIVKQANIPHLKAVPQFSVKDEATLKLKLNEMAAAGAEGLMLHRTDALYVTGRSDVLLKLKLQFDAEVKVMGYTAGRGKYKGQVGALVLETPEGVRFKLGTGISDAQRKNPPKIGSIVTYTYRDKTASGKPRFAHFLRVRSE